MDWKDVKDNITSCGCFLIPLLLIGLTAYFGMKNSSKHAKEKEAKDSIGHIRHLKYVDSLANILDYRDKITTVIVIDGDDTYHYYTDCNRICLLGDTDGELMLRFLAKEKGLTVCPECRSLFFHYRNETDSDDTPELYDYTKKLKEEFKIKE